MGGAASLLVCLILPLAALELDLFLGRDPDLLLVVSGLKPLERVCSALRWELKWKKVTLDEQTQNDVVVYVPEQFRASGNDFEEM